MLVGLTVCLTSLCLTFHRCVIGTSHVIEGRKFLFNYTLILCGPDVNQFRSIRCMLFCFEAVLGLKTNLFKSEVIPIGCVGNVQELANVLGCGLSSLPVNYLGLPLSARYKSVHIYDEIIERMERRLVDWKRMYLSKGGRITLIKSTLSSLPIYFLSLFLIPIVVA